MIRWNDPPATEPEEIWLLDKCRELGVDAKKVSYFISAPERFPVNKEIARLFANQIENTKIDWLRGTLLQAGAKREFRGIFIEPVLKIIRNEADTSNGTIAINALSRIATSEDINTIAELLVDTKLGDDRTLIVPIYARVAKRSAVPLLRKLTNDPVAGSQSLKHLAILGDTSIEHELLELAKHPDSYHRKIAQDALKRVEKSKQKTAKQLFQ